MAVAGEGRGVYALGARIAVDGLGFVVSRLVISGLLRRRLLLEILLRRRLLLLGGRRARFLHAREDY